MDFLKIDTLKEYHIQTSNSKIRMLVDNISALIVENNPQDRLHIYKLIEQLIAEITYLKKCYSNSALANQLEIDIEEATYLIEQLKNSYNIDDPIAWIKSFIDQANKNKSHASVKKSELMRGLQAIGQAEDTAEERKLKERKFNHNKLPTI